MTVVLLRVPLERPLLYGMLGISPLGVPLVLLGADPQLAAAGRGDVRGRRGQEVFSIGWNLAMQENIDDEMLSRAYSYDALGSFVAMPIGQIAYGPLGAAFGYEEVLVVSGVAYVAICMLTLLSRSVRDLPRRQTLTRGAEPSGQPAA